MLNYNLQIIAEILNGQLIGDGQKVVNSVIIDSRLAYPTTDQLFFALKGERHDAHHFIDELYQKGIEAFVVSRKEDYSKLFPKATFIIVSDTLNALHQLAFHHRSQLKYPIISITGSNGKTIVKEWLSQALSSKYTTVRSPKSYNSQVGVPLSLLAFDAKAQMGIVEAGISKPSEMLKLESIIKPEVGIITNLGAAHQENFQNIESKAREKMELFTHSRALIYSSNYPEIERIAKELNKTKGIELFSWGTKASDTIALQKIEKGKSETNLHIFFHSEGFMVTIPFTNDAAIENAMHCLALLLYLGYDPHETVELLKHLQPVAMRLEIKPGINHCTLINDSYNSDLGSLSIALDVLTQQYQHPQRMLILSDILQSGIKPQNLYEKVSEMIKEKGVNKTVGIGSEISQFKSLFPSSSEFFSTTQEFLKSFQRNSINNTAILLKGSRPFQFERISALIENQVHRTRLEINLNALTHNLNYFRTLLQPNVKIMAMVKAFSYGSGSHEIANLLQYHRVDYLGVAFTDEGIALREAGITLPIVVLNPEIGSYQLMVEYNLEPEIFNFASLKSFATTLTRNGISNYPIHLKIDTGMHRLGFMPSEVDELCQKLKEWPSIQIQSIFSHLVATDDANLDSFTLQQIEQFQEACERIEQTIGYKPIRHILNSAGIERFGKYQLDMVRLGIGLYGISTVHQQHLMHVGTLKTYVAQLHKIGANDTVGYNRKGIVQKSSTIATIPIGYADGLNRRLSNGLGKVFVNGQFAPIIGNISMDTCMIDVTHIPSIQEGDEVVVFGEKLSITEIAKTLDTIPYEVLSTVSRRVARVFVQE